MLFMFSLSAVLHAAAFEDIAANAEAVSYQAEKAELRYESGLIALEQSGLDDRTDYSVSFRLDPVDGDGEVINVSDLTFSVTLPDDDTTFSASVPFAVRYDAEGALISPSLSARHVFDWGRDDETLKELQTESSRLSVNREYSSDMLSLRLSVIDSISAILSNEKSIREEEETLRDLQRILSSDLELGNITKDSLLYQESMLGVKRSEDRLGILQDEREELLKRFSSLCGLPWDGVTDIPFPSFPDIMAAETSSELEEADIYARIAEEEYLLELSRQNPERLSVGISADSYKYLGRGLAINPLNENDSVSVLGELGWESRSWDLSLSGGVILDDDYSASPVLSVSGTWHSDAASESDALTLRSLQNTAEMRRGEYLDMRRSFEETGRELWNRIISWRRNFAEVEAEIEYQTALLDNARLRYERGLIPEEDLHDASFELDNLMIDRSVLLLEGLSLETEIDMQIL